MTEVRKLWPLLTATHRYDKSISTWRRGAGQLIEAPILAYLIETANGRILYDVGCDYSKIHDPLLRERYYRPEVFGFGAPKMTEEQRIPHTLSRLGLSPADIDVIFIGHLHFDHAGGLKELRRTGCGAEIHLHRDEMAAAGSGTKVNAAVSASLTIIDRKCTMLLTRNLWTLIATVLLAGVLPAQPRALEPITVQRRLAFVLGNHAFADRVVAASIHRDERKGDAPSDHVPVAVDLDLDVDDDDRPMIF